MVSAIMIGILILIFIGIGIALISEKGLFLIAGYNTMSKEEQEAYDHMALAKFMGKKMFLFAFSIFLG